MEDMMRQKLLTWGVTPVYIPRWALTVLYFLFVVLGVTAFLAGIPTLDLTTWTGYTSFWAAGIALSGVVASIASIRRQWETTERWSVLVLVSILAVYWVAALVLVAGGGEHATGRAAFAVVLTIVTLLPVARLVSLIHHTGEHP